MSRYYYDCPIEAAYMAKRFGMLFLNEETEGCPYVVDIKLLIERNYFLYPIKKLYIHPDSLWMLKPRDFDVGFDLFNNPTHYMREIGWYRVNDQQITGEPKIIMRKGNHFIWPKQEESNGK